ATATQRPSQNTSDHTPAEADAGAEQQESGGEEEAHDVEENSYFNEAQGLQTPRWQPQTRSSTDVSPDQHYFPLSAPPPTPL
ncbi:hypothetical protein OFB51_26910, partial [Escherichia coli]|nr:hypothetical protein [Escherichia coli]